jgi:hypothetical protein
MFSNLDHMKDLPKTTKVHEHLASAMFRHFNVRAREQRTEHDPVFYIAINDTHFYIHIVAERDSKRSFMNGFPWNSRWNLSLEGNGVEATVRPKDHELYAASEKLAKKIRGFIDWKAAPKGRFAFSVIIGGKK